MSNMEKKLVTQNDVIAPLLKKRKRLVGMMQAIDTLAEARAKVVFELDVVVAKLTLLEVDVGALLDVNALLDTKKVQTDIDRMLLTRGIDSSISRTVTGSE